MTSILDNLILLLVNFQDGNKSQHTLPLYRNVYLIYGPSF